MSKVLSLVSYFPIHFFLPWKLKINFRALKAVAFILAGALFVLYIFQIISIIQKTYLLQNYEKELTVISENSNDLEIKVAKINSLDSIESVIQELNYENIGKVKYIQLMEPQVVAK